MTTTIFRRFKFHLALIIAALCPAGLFFGLSLFTILTSPQHVGFTVFCLIVASVFGAIGGRLFLFQNGLEFDLDKGVFVKWLRSGGKREEETIALDSLERVKLSSEIVKHVHRESYGYSQSSAGRNPKTSTWTVYPVSLVDKSGQDQPVIACSTYSEARGYAEQMARKARLDLHDTTTSPAVTRSYDRLDESLGARLLRKGAEVEVSDPPQGSGIKLLQTEDETLISLPGKGVIGMVGAFVLLFLGFPLMILMAAFSKANETAILVTAAVIFGISGLIIWDALAPRMIKIKGDSLSIRQLGGLRRNLGRIPLSELEEVIASAGRLLCRSDSREVVIPLKNNDSARWLRKALEKVALDRETPESPS